MRNNGIHHVTAIAGAAAYSLCAERVGCIMLMCDGGHCR
jgi:hypothetical protein